MTPLLGVLSILVVIFSAVPQPAQATTSDVLNFQARLLNSAGAVVADGNYNVEFKIYTASSSSGSSQGSCTGDAQCKWVETRTSGNVVRVVDGYLTVNLGSVSAFSSTMPWDQQLWLTMNIGGTGSPSWDGEMSPRIQLTSVPYSFRSASLADTVGSGTGTLKFTTLTTDRNILLPDEAGTVCIQNSVNCGFLTSGGGGGSFILNGTSLQSPANFHIQSVNSTSIGGVIQAASSATADIFQLQNGSGTPVASFGSTGRVTFTTTTNDNFALTVNDSSNNSVLTVDTANARVGVGTSSPSNTFSVSPIVYSTGTASQTGTTVTGTGTTWTADMVGDEFIFANTNKYTITGFTDATHLTLSGSASNGSQAYTIHNPAFYVSSTGTAALRTSTNSTTAFQIQDASNSSLFTADTTNGKVGIGLTPSSSGATLQVSGRVDATTGFATNGTNGTGLTCAAGEIVVQQTVAGGIVTGGTCTSPNAGGLTPTLQQVYDASISSPQITLDSSPGAGGLVIQDASTTVGGNLFAVQNNGGTTSYIAVTTSGVTVTGDINISGIYKVGGVQISTSNLSDAANIALLNATQTFTGANTFAPTGNNVGTTIKQTSGTATAGNVLDIQTANGLSHFLQITNAAANEGAVTLQSIGATRDLNLQSGSGFINLGSTNLISNNTTSGLQLEAIQGDLTLMTDIDAINLTSNGDINVLSGGDINISGTIVQANGSAIFKNTDLSSFSVQNASGLKVLTVNTAAGAEKLILGTGGASGLTGTALFNFNG
ncbi:hypothetical protein KW789_00680, partial [Candidatus Saccharibacteria bacterium]|nr:hypothetical protein [Candidatus Saccharibacteria bacterium]